MEKKISPNLAPSVLAINAFVVGSTELIGMGLLPMIARSFHISLSQADLTASLCALSVTIGAPLLTILIGKWNRHSSMLGIMFLLTSGNLVAVSASTFIILLVGRILSALARGIFISVSIIIAADAVPPSCCVSVVAIMLTGLAIITVTGMPLGTLTGQQTAWHMSLLFIASIDLVGLTAGYLLVPKNLPIPGRVDTKGITRAFTNRLLVFSFPITAFGYSRTFAAYTYSSPLLENLGFSANVVVIILVVYSIMVAIDNTIGDHWTNKKPLDSLVRMLNLLILSLVFLFIAILTDNSLLSLLASLVLGLFIFINISGLWLHVVKLTEKYVPEGITLASAFNIAAFNIGTTAGSMTDGVVTDYLSVTYTPIFGDFIMLTAILFVLYIRKQEEQKNSYL